MIRTPFLHGVVFVSFTLTAYLAGCVDIPSTGPASPNYTAEIRIINLDPSLANATISYANGPFTAGVLPPYAEVALGPVADNSQPYTTWPAGGKKLLVKNVDVDTSALTFSTDARGTLYVIPTTDIKVTPRFVLTSERYTFAPPGKADTTRINFFNSLAASTDTVDFWYAYQDTGTTVVTGVAAQAVTVGKFSATIFVPAGAVRTYYATAVGGTAAMSDSVTITGASNKDYTIAVYGDSLTVAHLQQFLRY